MQKSSPTYRINYLFCKEYTHSSEKANMICLNQQCCQNSLVCSLCLEEKHKGHQTKPLKHFLSGLQRKYAQEKNSTVNTQLEELQQNRLDLLTTIRKAVESLAQRFMELECEVIQKYEQIKSQILQREAKRNRFTEFYNSMALQGKGDPNFQIQNYLQFEPLQAFNMKVQLDKFIQSSNANLRSIKNALIINKKDTFISEENFSIVKQITEVKENDFVVPLSIKRNGNIFTQKNPNTKQTLMYLNTYLKNWTYKLRIKILSLPGTAKFTMGVANIQDIIASNGIFPLKNQASIFSLDSTGKTQNNQYNHIMAIKTGDQVFAVVKKNNIKINVNGSQCCYHLYNKEKEGIYFSLEGLCEVEMVYPYVKG